MIFPKGIKYNNNNTGPKTEPWGTPQNRSADSDLIWLAVTLKLRPDRYDENQCKTDPDSPTSSLSLLSRIWWLTVSKDEDRSKRTRTVHFPESANIIMSLDTFSKAVSIEWCLWKPDWNVSWMLLWSRNNDSWSETTFSMILDKSGSFEIGLKLLRSVGSKPVFLSKGFTMACLNVLGNTPVERERLTIFVTQEPITSNTFTKSLYGRTSDEQEEGFVLVTSAEISRVTDLNEDHKLETGSMTAGVPHKGGGIFSLIILILSLKNLNSALLSASQKTGNWSSRTYKRTDRVKQHFGVFLIYCYQLTIIVRSGIFHCLIVWGHKIPEIKSVHLKVSGFSETLSRST